MKFMLLTTVAIFALATAIGSNSGVEHDLRPTAYFGKVTTGKMAVSEIKKVDHLIVRDAAGTVYEIANFTFVFQRKNGEMQMAQIQGGDFNDRVKELLAQTEAGTLIIFTDIHYKNANNEIKALGSGIEIKAATDGAVAYFGSAGSGSMNIDDVRAAKDIKIIDAQGKSHSPLRFTMVVQYKDSNMVLDKTYTGTFSSRMNKMISGIRPGDIIIVTDIYMKTDEDQELRLDNGVVIEVR